MHIVYMLICMCSELHMYIYPIAAEICFLGWFIYFRIFMVTLPTPALASGSQEPTHHLIWVNKKNWKTTLYDIRQLKN